MSSNNPVYTFKSDHKSLRSLISQGKCCPWVACSSLIQSAVAWRAVLANTVALSRSEAARSCATLCDSVDYSLSVSSVVHGIFQARVLEWVAIAFSEMFIKDKLLVRYLMEVSLINGQILEGLTSLNTDTVLVILHSFNMYTH